MSDERLPVQPGDQSPSFDQRTTSPLVRRGLARLSAMAAARPGSSEIALSEDDRPVLLWSFKGYENKPLERSDGKALALRVATTELVVVGMWDGEFRALDASTGVERWCSPLSLRGSTQIVRGVLYISYSGADLTAKDLQTGEDRWFFDPGDEATKSRYDDIIYVLDVASGEERCRYRIGDDGAHLPPPTDDVIYVSQEYVGEAGRQVLHVLDADAWERYKSIHHSNAAEFNPGWSLRWLFGDDSTWTMRVYLNQGRIHLDFWGHPIDGYHRIIAVDSATNAEIWRIEGLFSNYEISESCGTIYIGLEGRGSGSCIVALDATTGMVRWSWPGGSKVITAAHGMNFVCGNDVGESSSDFGGEEFGDLTLTDDEIEGDVVALDAMSGEKVWSCRSRRIPILTDDIAYVVNRGVLYALDIRTGRERWQLTIHDRIDDESADPQAQSLAAELATTPTVQVVGDMIYASTGYTLFAFREPRIARE